MKKVFFYINTLRKGGAERVILQLATLFNKNGYNTTLITSFNAEDEYKMIDSIKRVSLFDKQIQGSRLMRNYKLISSLRSYCKRESPDVLVSFMQEPNFRAVISTIGLKTKTVVSIRNDPKIEYSGRVGRFIGKLILPFANGAVFQTKEAMEWFPKRLKRKSIIIPNPVKEQFFITERKPNYGEIVSVGRLEPQKNFSLLIKAFSKVSEILPNLKLKIYGEGTLRKELSALIQKLDLTQSVFLMGQTDDVANALSTADVFVLSSDYEGMPNALMEAMAMGIPCVSTNCPCGGPRMLINDGENGFLFQVGDQSDLEQKLLNVFSNEEIKHFISDNAKESSKCFDSERVYKKWKSFLKI